MSRHSPDHTVQEIAGKLRFPKPAANDYLLAIARAPVVEGDKLKRLVAKMGDKAARKGLLSGKATCVLPQDYLTKLPYQNFTPKEFRHVTVRKDGDKFSLVEMGSGCDFLPGHLKVLGLENFETKLLAMNEAVAQGKLIEDAYVRLNKKAK